MDDEMVDPYMGLGDEDDDLETMPIDDEEDDDKVGDDDDDNDDDDM